MTPAAADALAKRWINIWRGGPSLTEIIDALLPLDEGRAGTALVRLRNESDHAPSIARFLAVYRSLDTSRGDEWRNRHDDDEAIDIDEAIRRISRYDPEAAANLPRSRRAFGYRGRATRSVDRRLAQSTRLRQGVDCTGHHAGHRPFDGGYTAEYTEAGAGTDGHEGCRGCPLADDLTTRSGRVQTSQERTRRQPPASRANVDPPRRIRMPCEPRNRPEGSYNSGAPNLAAHTATQTPITKTAVVAALAPASTSASS